MAFIPAPPVSRTPPPPPPPTPAITALNIIDAAPTGNLAVAGVTATGLILDPAMMTDASLAPADQPQMRYDAGTNTYEVKFPGAAWESLSTRDTSDPDWARPVGVGESGTVMGFNLDRKIGEADAYPYSTIAWYSERLNRFGMIAVGIATPAGAVPTSGSARYDGIITGDTNVFADSGDGYGRALGVNGSVTLSFDFSGGTLSGSMEPKLESGSLGVFTFQNAVYSAGAYSGQFNSSATGVNGFYGQMTGPRGEELIGAWALPFHYSIDNQDHQATGAWVAKQ